LNPQEYLSQTARDTRLVQETFLAECGEKLIEVSRLLGECLHRGRKLLIFGNGGSAADAQHLAAELVGRMLTERRALPALALTTDTSNLTAIGNDYGFDQVFSRQLQALAQPGDLVFAISTSGNSPNVLRGVKEAREIGCHVVGLAGGAGGKLRELCDIFLNVSGGKNSSRIQESHIFAIHSIVDMLDRFFLKPAGPGNEV
jgi:D-sedoheptulose 7-phosphate isomerase